jgi:hypothetical protein
VLLLNLNLEDFARKYFKIVKYLAEESESEVPRVVKMELKKFFGEP